MQKSRSQIIFPAVASGLLFSVLTFFVIKEPVWFQYLDAAIFELPYRTNETIVTIFGIFAKSATIVPMLVVSSAIAMLLWRKGQLKLGVWLLGNLLWVAAIGFVLKHLIGRSRPDVEQLIERSSYSFPSGHTLLATAFVCSLLFILERIYGEKRKKGLRAVLILYVFLIAFTRIFLRVHYPSDVLAGFLLSFSCVHFSYFLFFRNEPVQQLQEKRQYPGFSFKKKLLIAVLTIILFLISSISVYGIKAFQSAKNAAQTMHQPLARENPTLVEVNKQEPVSILILGIANDAKRQVDYRANTIMVATINNDLKQTTLTSIPRDAYVEIVGKNGLKDKINHAHAFGGVEMIMDTVEKYLEIPIHHYATINMDGLADLVEALGGVTVDNAFEFNAEGIHYPKGVQHLNGWETLQYTRMRYEDPEGDYGRQRRQREVTELLMEKLISVESIFRYNELMEVIGENGQTDLTFDQMTSIITNYQKALMNVQSYQVLGEGFTGDGYTGEYGISYQQISEEERITARDRIKQQLEIE